MVLNISGGANVPISGLPDATLPLTGAEFYELTQDGKSRKATVTDLLANLPGLTASFITVASDPNLINERVLTAGTNVTLVDGGPGGALTINAAGGGSPTLEGLTDVDLTGQADNDMFYRSGGVWIDTAGQLIYDGTDLTLVSGHLQVPQVNEPATPTIALGAGNTGLFGVSAGTLGISAAANHVLSISSAVFQGIRDNTRSPRLDIGPAVGALEPVYSFRGDNDTGVGLADLDQLSLISGGVEIARFVEDTESYVRFEFPTFISEIAAALTDQAGYGQVWVRNDTPNNLMFTDDAGNDFVIGGSGATSAGFEFDRFGYQFSTSTLTGNPGAGFVRINNATPSSGTVLILSDTDSDGNNLDGRFQTLGGGSVIRIEDQNDPSIWNEFVVSGSINDQTTHYQPTFRWIRGSDTISADNAAVWILLQRQTYIQPPTAATTSVATLAIFRQGLSANPINGLLEADFSNTGLRTGISTNSADLRFVDGGIEEFVISVNGTLTTMETDDANGIIRIESNVTEFYDKNGTLPEFQIGGNFIQTGHPNDSGDSAPVFYMHERTNAAGDVAEFGQIWVRDDAPCVLMFTDDTGQDFVINNLGVAATITGGWSTGAGGSLTIGANAPLLATEQAANDSPGAGEGQIWLRNDVPNTLMFTDDAGNDFVVAGSIVGGLPLKGFLDADLSVASSTALQNVTNMQFSLAATTRYKIRFVGFIISNTTGTDPGARFRLDYTGTVTTSDGRSLEFNDVGLLRSARMLPDTTILGFTAGSATDEVMVIYEAFIETGTAGTLTMQFSQSVSNATATTLQEGAYIEVIEE